MRSFDLHAAALALDVSNRKIDNLLARSTVDASHPARGRGRRRHLSFDTVVALAVALDLASTLGISELEAMRTARAIVANGGTYAPSAMLALQVDLPRLRASLEERLAGAVEVVVAPRRGRPPRPRTSRVAMEG